MADILKPAMLTYCVASTGGDETMCAPGFILRDGIAVVEHEGRVSTIRYESATAFKTFDDCRAAFTAKVEKASQEFGADFAVVERQCEVLQRIRNAIEAV